VVGRGLGDTPSWDIGLHYLGPGTLFVPAWYPIACVSFDLLVAVYVACSMLSMLMTATPSR
jgi:hypothetical protein